MAVDLGSSLCGPLCVIAWTSSRNDTRVQSTVLRGGRMWKLKPLKAQPLKSLSLTPRAFCLLQQVYRASPDFTWEGTQQGCECWESWLVVGHLWELVTIPINNIVKEGKSSTHVSSYEAAMSQSNRARRTWILVSSVTDFESSVPSSGHGLFICKVKNFEE